MNMNGEECNEMKQGKFIVEKSQSFVSGFETMFEIEEE